MAETHLQSISHVAQYHLHYMPHISTLQVVYVSYSWSLCLLLCAGALGWRLWLAVFPVLPVPGTACPLHNAISSILHHSPHLLLFVFVAAMWVHLPAQPPSQPASHITITQVVHATSELSICTAATVNSCFIVWLPLVACFQLHSQG
ncbi:MAG: hypothetical protein IPN89_06620 [Saprospiraceae bacterium]|nr:hypothetical protein [Saprospiraceae bacterium]